MNLQKHFEAADKEKSGLIDSEGLQSMIHSIGACDSFLAREFAHAIHNSKEQKCSLAQLQSIVDSLCHDDPPTQQTSLADDQPDGACNVPPNLIGTWKNELNSTLVIEDSPNPGQFFGYYRNGASGGKTKGDYPLVGRFDSTPPVGQGQSLGWTVQWSNRYGDLHSNTVWEGQYYILPNNGKKVIKTTWLLGFSTTLEKNFQSVFVGKDEFIKM